MGKLFVPAQDPCLVPFRDAPGARCVVLCVSCPVRPVRPVSEAGGIDRKVEVLRPGFFVGERIVI